MLTREWLAQATPDARTVYLDAMLGAFANVMGEIAKCAALCEDLGDHTVDGVDSMARTLIAKGLSPATAAELVRVGHALVDLPETEAALAENTVTFDQVRQLSKFLTPETDKTVEDFCARSVRSLEREAARHRPPPEPATAQDRWKRRSLHHFIDPVTGMFKLSFKGTPEDGAVIASTLAAVAETFDKDPDTGLRDPLHQRLADSLVEVCGTHDPETNPAGSDRGCVSVHISAELLLEHYNTDTGLCDLNLPVSTRLAKDTVRRLMCDGMAEAIYHDHDGNIIGIDEARRAIPPRLYRQLALRDDNTCRWPGCSRRSYLQGHHIQWVEHDGLTQLANLVLLCWRHHRNVHDGDYTIDGHPDHNLTFRRPDGTPIPSRPPPLPPELKHRLC